MTLLARALYHNDAEAPNELTFRKGEILTVLNRTPQGLAGWWICNVRGKIGLAPGNRLQLLGVVQPTPEMRAEANSATYDDPPNVYDVLPSPSPSEKRRLPPADAPLPPGASDPAASKGCGSLCSDGPSQADSVYQVPDDDHVYQIPIADVEVYNVPPDHDFHLSTGDNSHSNRSSGISSMTYQVPPTPISPVSGNASSNATKDSKENLATTPDSQFEDYDAVASSAAAQRPRPVVTSTPRKNTLGSCSDYYNIDEPAVPSTPPPVPPGRPTSSTPNNRSVESLSGSARSVHGSAGSLNRRSFSPVSEDAAKHLSSASSLRSIDYADMPALPDQRLSLSRETALELLDKVKSSAESNTAKLFKFISSKWKTVNSLVINVGAIRTTCEALARDVDEFIRFSYTVLAGANASADAALPKKIWKHLKPLEENHRTMRSAIQALAAINWRPEDVARLSATPETDHLNTVVTSIRSISIDMRSLSVTTNGNAPVLFPEKVKASAVAPSGSGGGGGGGGVTSQLTRNDSVRMTAPSVDWPRMAAATDSMDYLEMTTKRLSLQSQTLSREERESLKWYSAQLESGVDILNQATDSLFKSIEKSQPPNVFVQHSKFVVMSAQKLVYVGDSIGRSLKYKPLAHEILTNASDICELLKVVVSATKVAAEKHPSPQAIQSMMDAVVKVSSAASRLQLVVANSANSVF